MKIILFYISLFVATCSAHAGIQSAFNDLGIETDSTGNYSFILSGHFHGSGTNRTGYPTQTLLANLEWINQSESAFLVCLGDLFLDVSNDIPFYEKSLFSKLRLPLFNAVGNHDLTGSIYEDNFGDTYYYFEVGNDIHIILNTEMNNGSIKGEQLDLLKEVGDKVKNGDYSNLFIHSHRTVWAKHYTDLDALFKDNTQATFGNNFSDEIYPLIKELSQHTNIIWTSGSMGDAPVSFFNYKDADASITYIVTAIRGLKRDAVLKIDLVDNKPQFTPVSFTGEDLLPFEAYNVTFWNERVGQSEPFNYRLIPYYVKHMVVHYYFWFGALFGLISILCLRFVFRKIKKRRSV